MRNVCDQFADSCINGVGETSPTHTPWLTLLLTHVAVRPCAVGTLTVAEDPVGQGRALALP